MSERSSGGSSIGDAIGMAVLIFAVVMFFIIVAIVTFLASPGMLIVGTAKLVFGLAHSTRQLWVLSIAMSAAILISLVITRRNFAQGVALHLLLCAVTMILWSVLAYGFEFRATESLAAVFFPGFTIKAGPATAASVQAPVNASTEADRTVAETELPAPELERQAPVEPTQPVARRAVVALPLRAAPLPAPTPIPMASFRVALQLPLKRAYVMVRLNDREVFRADFRPGNQSGMPALETPPIEAVAGLVIVKVWVISPDKTAADEYLVLPVEFEAGESRRLGLVFDPKREAGGRLVPTMNEYQSGKLSGRTDAGGSGSSCIFSKELREC